MSGLQNNRFAIYVASGRIIAMLAQFAMPVFLTRFLSESEYGVYSQFYLILTFLGGILCFGIQSNLYYFYSHIKIDERTTLVWNNLLIMTILGIIGSFLLFIPCLRHTLIGEGDINNYWLILGICITLFIPTNFTAPLAVVCKDKALATFYPPADIILKIILVIPLALIFKTLNSIFWGILILQICEFLFIFSYVIIRFGFTPISKALNYEIIKQQLSYSLPFGGAVILNTLCQRLDKFVCISHISESEYAVYSIAFFGIPGIMQIYDSICQVNVTNMSEAHAQGDYNTIMRLYKQFIIQTLSFSLPIILIVCLFAPQFIEFAFSSKYIESVPYFRIYIITFIFGMIGCGTILRAIGKTRLSFKAYLLSTIIFIPVCISLINIYGITGAIISATVGTILPKVFQTFYEIKSMKKTLTTFFPWKEIFKISIIAVIFLIPAIIYNQLYHIQIWAAIIIVIAYLIVTYSIQIKLGVFILNKDVIITKLNTIKSRIFSFH